MNNGFTQFVEDIRRYVGEPKCILDIGSRDGEEALEFQKVFPNAEIHAFEPSEENHKICKENLKDTCVGLWRLAVSDNNEFSTFFYTPGNIGASSLARPLNVPWTHDQRVIEEEIQNTTLDFWSMIHEVTPDVIWIDVQSQELRAFIGGRETLKNVKAIYTEAGLVPYYENHTMRDDIVKELVEVQGFTLIRDEKDWEKETNLTFVRV